MAGEVGRAQTVHGCGPYSGLWSLPGNYRHPLKDFKQENGMTRLKFQSNHLGCEQKQTGGNIRSKYLFWAIAAGFMSKNTDYLLR